MNWQQTDTAPAEAVNLKIVFKNDIITTIWVAYISRNFQFLKTVFSSK